MKRLLLSFLTLLLLLPSGFPQTATDPNEGSRFISLGNSNFQFTWWGRAGRSYLVEFSDDLATWTYINTLFSGADAVSPPIGFNNVGGSRMFVRLQTDPFNTDTDADGIPDGWEIQFGLNPRNPADALIIASGGLSYLQAYQMGIDPNDPLQGAAPAAPTGLRITFPVADQNPDDPDISQIQVEWNAPVETGVTVTFEKTYAGDPAGGGTPVSLSSVTQSPIFSGLLSKRIYQYRVIFAGSNGKSSSTDIAYELPVIRGLMQRKIATDMKFPGVLMYPGLPFTVTPRKFRGLTHTWSFDSTSTTNYTSGSTSTTTAHQGGSYSRHLYLYTHSHSILGEAHDSETTTDTSGSGNYSWNQDRSYSFDLTEPSALDPSGSVSSDSTGTINQTSGDSHSWGQHLLLGLGLQPFQIADANGNQTAPLPFSSFTATDSGRYFDGNLIYGDADDFSWTASPTLLPDQDGQHLNWSGSFDWIITSGGTTNTTTGQRNYGNSRPGLGFASVASGDFYPDRTGVITGTADGYWGFPQHGENPPPGVTPDIAFSGDGLSWTRSYTYSSSGSTYNSSNTYTETWTETVTVSDEITAADLTDAAVQTYAPMSNTIGRFLPGQQPQSRFSSGFSVDSLGLYEGWSQFTYPWLEWDYTHSHSGITPAQLAAASAPGQSYVTVNPQFGALVGEYSLNADETSANLLSSEYKFRSYPPAESCTIAWLETFTPDPVEPDQTQQYQIHTYTVPAGQAQMPDSALLAVDSTEAWSAQAAGNAPQAAPPAPKRQGQVMLGAGINPTMQVDSNNDGHIDGNDKGTITESNPWRFWLNDDDDVNGVNGWQHPDYANAEVDGQADLKDFFPVFLDIQQVVKALPPSATVKYKLKQADGAVNFVETRLGQGEAFSYVNDTLPVGYGINLAHPARLATSRQITPAGVELSSVFLTNIGDSNKGIILVEGRVPTTKPLVLTVEENGVERLQVSLPLALNARILLLLHGMNSNTQTWDTFVQQQIGLPVAKWATDIRVNEGEIAGQRPMLNSTGVRCYRLQFGGYENGNTRMGLEDLTAAIAPNYLNNPLRRCGDFETFTQLGQEIDDAITLLLARPEYQNAQIILVGHSRGGIAARAFLQMADANASKTAVVGFLTTGTPHTGSRMGRIYKWLKDHPRPTPPATNDDWDVVKTLFEAPDGGLDIRRPVNGDVADNSEAMVNLNLPAEVAKMPADIRYGQIVYANSDLGRLARTFIPETSIPFVYTVLGSQWNLGPQLSDAAQTSVLAGVAPAGYPGDDLIPRQNQKFPAGVLSNGGNIVTLENLDADVLHTEEPGRDQDLHLQLIRLMSHWFFRP